MNIYSYFQLYGYSLILHGGFQLLSDECYFFHRCVQGNIPVKAVHLFFRKDLSGYFTHAL